MAFMKEELIKWEEPSLKDVSSFKKKTQKTTAKDLNIAKQRFVEILKAREKK
jgi:hypothetical protein